MLKGEKAKKYKIPKGRKIYETTDESPKDLTKIFYRKVELHLEEIAEMSKCGYSIAEIAKKLKISSASLYYIIKQFPIVYDKIEEGKTVGDAINITNVENALLKGATGYEYSETSTTTSAKGRSKVVNKKHMKGETAAQKYYLSHKAPDKWKDGIEIEVKTSLESFFESKEK